MRYAVCASFILATCAASLAQAAPSPSEDLAHSVAEFSGKACFGIVSGAIKMPTFRDPRALEKSRQALEGLGLISGLTDSMLKGLGRPGIPLIQRSTMGAKSFEQGDVVLALDGLQPGCRIILLSEASASITEAVSANLLRADWKAVPNMTYTRDDTERRAFVRRDEKGNRYLISVMAPVTPMPGSTIRLVTSTDRVPDSVQLPGGL